MDKLCYIFLYFVFYSIIGYVCEVFYVYLGDKKWVNRGFLHGPYIPIYGNGAMIVSLALMHVKKDSFIIFLGSKLNSLFTIFIRSFSSNFEVLYVFMCNDIGFDRPIP